MGSISDSNAKEARSFRVTFDFEGGNLSLRDMRSSKMRPLPNQNLDKNRDFWFELHDENKQVIYSRSQINLLNTDIEHIRPGENPMFERQPSANGSFHLFVPAIDETTLWIYSSISKDSPIKTYGPFNISLSEHSSV